MIVGTSTETATPDGIVIVGAGAAGLSVAEGLRRGGYEGRLRMYGAEEHPPYDRPPLSKQVLLGTWQEQQTRLRDPVQLADLGIELHLGQEATGLDTGGRTVRFGNSAEVHYDQLVIATGLRPRTIPGQADLSGVHSLHSLADARALRAGLAESRTVVIVGAGVLGCELAASARSLGKSVTLVASTAAPMQRPLGVRLGGILADVHREHGVELRLSTRMGGLVRAEGRVTAVRLEKGELLPADLVAITIGSRPTTDWLEGSTLVLDDGIVCDNRCRAADRVWAVGDIARFPDPLTGALTRLENRTNATDQGLAVAGNLLGADEPYAPVPYFWTDQYDLKVQSHGVPAPETVLVEGAVAEGRFVALHGTDDAVTGVVGFNRPKQTRQWRRYVVEATPWSMLPAGAQGLVAEPAIAS